VSAFSSWSTRQATSSNPGNESALAIAKRLLVVSMAYVTVWAIAANNSKVAAELRVFPDQTQRPANAA